MRTGEKETIAEHLRSSGVSRRDFLQLCSKIMVVAPVGLALTHKTTAAQVASPARSRDFDSERKDRRVFEGHGRQEAPDPSHD